MDRADPQADCATEFEPGPLGQPFGLEVVACCQNSATSEDGGMTGLAPPAAGLGREGRYPAIGADLAA